MHRGYFLRNMHGKCGENAGKIGEFPRNPILEVAEQKGDPAVVSGHFRSFSQSFPVIPGYDSDSFRFLSVFIPFHSFSFLIFKLYYYFCTGIYSINCSYEENYSNFSHHFYGYWR